MFYRFKSFLKQRFNDALTASQEHKTKAMVGLLTDAVKEVLQGHQWQYAFRQNGILGGPGAFMWLFEKEARLCSCWGHS